MTCKCCEHNKPVYDKAVARLILFQDALNGAYSYLCQGDSGKALSLIEPLVGAVPDASGGTEHG